MALPPRENSGVESYVQRIYSSLSNTDSLSIFKIAAEGIVASSSAPKDYGLTKKRYYPRLKELVDLGLICKLDGVYRHTALGSVIYVNQVLNLQNILLRRSNLEMLQRLRDSQEAGSSREQDLLALDAVSHEILKDLESEVGLSNLKPIKIFRTWEELGAQVVALIENMQSEIYVATRYVDFRTAMSAFKAASGKKGAKVNILHSPRSGLSTRMQVMGNLMANPDALRIFKDLAHNPNISMKQSELPYSFIVVDRLSVGIEIVDPHDPITFFIGILFESPTLASKLITYFQEIEKTAERDPMIAMFENGGKLPNAKPENVGSKDHSFSEENDS